MARIRTIKPEFFRHEGLFAGEKESGLPLRVAFAGLWTAADREGRFEWRPRNLKLDCLPYDDVDFAMVLDELAKRGFIVKYKVGLGVYGMIPGWRDHQVVNNRELSSTIPSISEGIDITSELTRAPRVPHACPTRHGNCKGEREREGEGERKEEVIPKGLTSFAVNDEKSSFPADEKLVKKNRKSKAIDFDYETGVWSGITEGHLGIWSSAYPALDLKQQISAAGSWLMANPANRKSNHGRYLTNWFQRAQQNAPRVGGVGGAKQKTGTGLGPNALAGLGRISAAASAAADHFRRQADREEDGA